MVEKEEQPTRAAFTVQEFAGEFAHALVSEGITREAVAGGCSTSSTTCTSGSALAAAMTRAVRGIVVEQAPPMTNPS